MRTENNMNRLSEAFGWSRQTVVLLFILAVLLMMTLGQTSASGEIAPAGDGKPVAAGKDVKLADKEITAEAAKLAAQWGIKVASIRLTANNHMIDYRYQVLDSAKATGLFERKIKPQLIHQKSGKVLAVPETAKVGPLRNSNIPKEGKIYWMFFGNAGQLVKAGDKVSVVIGDFKVENLVVQ